MSLFRLVVTCLWIVTVGGFLVYLEAERVTMRSQILKWEEVREEALQLKRDAAYEYWCAFQKNIPAGTLKQCLEREKEGGMRWQNLY